MLGQQPFHTQWCVLLKRYMGRCDLTQVQLGKILGIPQAMLSAYLLGKNRPPLERMSDIAKALDLKGEEREDFEWAAHEAHVPPAVWAHMARLKRLNRAAARELVAAREKIGHLGADLSKAALQAAQLARKVADMERELVGIRAKVDGGSVVRQDPSAEESGRGVDSVPAAPIG